MQITTSVFSNFLPVLSQFQKFFHLSRASIFKKILPSYDVSELSYWVDCTNFFKGFSGTTFQQGTKPVIYCRDYTKKWNYCLKWNSVKHVCIPLHRTNFPAFNPFDLITFDTSTGQSTVSNLIIVRCPIQFFLHTFKSHITPVTHLSLTEFVCFSFAMTSCQSLYSHNCCHIYSELAHL